MRRLTGGGHPWQYGTYPKVRLYDGEPVIIHTYPRGTCKDGSYEEVLVLCPFCGASAPPCPACKGSGSLQPLTEREDDKALVSLVEEFRDEDITLYLLP